MSINRENADIQSEDAMEDPNKKADTKYEQAGLVHENDKMGIFSINEQARSVTIQRSRHSVIWN